MFHQLIALYCCCLELLQFSQSYPMVLLELLAPIVALAGVNLVVTNGAMGNTAVYPYSYCVEAHVGQTPDIVSWEVR
jgi:hypothetical protein